MRRGLRSDQRNYTPHHLQLLDTAEPGSVLIYVMENALEIAAIGNLMATTAKLRDIEGIVIDGATERYSRYQINAIPCIYQESESSHFGRPYDTGRQANTRYLRGYIS
jgi:hypothetical protein